ncbi:LOW QUALITY PROTEIN: hypothetical protein OSB04_018290 [Centaurea solstitialis]|uniref:F-box associated beta-propeller type 3 domain-containing protein n=1 Tax=Centaurea solstitialis TaxID=347529 RepID=A0AA38TGC7_9ASTR|nr:LOW QUALITY PROTEIN: hypothetical protein OSB04_018290 [Centaurea solstitialis]
MEASTQKLLRLPILMPQLGTIDDHAIQICNPSLSAVVTLPPYAMPSPLAVAGLFGFDPLTDDYKVVKIMSRCVLPPDLAGLEGCLGPHSYDVVKDWLQVEVYSMRKELITEKFPSHFTSIWELNQDFVDNRDGHLHWLGCIKENKKMVQKILAFDMGVNSFIEIRLPDSVYRWNCVGVWMESFL